MLISRIQPYQNLQYSQPSFSGVKIIDLDYVINKREYLLPERVLAEVRKLSGTKNMPTLKELHQKIYSPLMECKTLEEAKELFPEFAGVKPADKVFERNTGNIRKLVVNGHLNDKLSLKLLQEVWVNLKSQDAIAKELGLNNRSGLGWILKKIGFVNYSSNYRTLVLSTDSESRAVIAGKTTAWNASHPDLMRQKNKYAAQFCKTEEYKKAHSKRMIEYDKAHPERINKIREFHLEVWKKVPEIRKAMSRFAGKQDSFTRLVIIKERSGNNLSPFEKRLTKVFYKKFWKANPELKKKYKEAYETVRSERAGGNGVNRRES